MARRRSEPLSESPAAELDSKNRNSQLHTEPAAVWRNHKGKSFYVNKSGKYRLRHYSPTVATRTRAQTRQKQQQSSAGRVTRPQRRKPAHLHTPCSSSSSPAVPASLFPRGDTVAASTSRGTPASGQRPATRSRSELRLRERVKVDTPDSSSNGLDLDRRAEDNGGTVSHDGADRGADPRDRGASEGEGGGESEREEEGEEEEEGEMSVGGSDGECDMDDIVAGTGDVAGEVVVGALNARASSDEEEGADEGEDDSLEEDEEEGYSADGDGVSCQCTSNWSCGGHAGQKRAGPSSSTPRFQEKRRFTPDLDGDEEISPSKKGCRLVSRTRSNLRPLNSIGLGGASCSKPARQRIPSREHPPPKLQQWLDTFKLWSNAERMMALDDLIALCDPSQVRHMMHVIEPQFQRDFISLLPKELALYVLSFLDPRDLLRAAQTCRYWHVLCEDNLLWREKCREEGIDETLVYGSRPRRRPGPRSPCKALFMRQSQIEHNWRTGTSRCPKSLKGHDDHVITCLEFCGHRIVSGSDDNTLKVWSVLSGKCLRTLVGHTGGVWSSQMSGNVIISGSTDRTLKVWNADTGTCKHTLYGHTSTVRCMSLCGSKVVSGSRDATLRVWDIETGQCLHVLMGHVAAVRCVQYDGRRVVSGAYDYTVRVWDPETENCLHTLQGHSNRVYSLQFDGVHVVSGSLDTSIRVWDVETGACLHTLIGHQSLTSGLELKDNILVSGNADSTVKVWDITTGQCLQTLQGPNKHQSAVTCLQFSKKFVITSSDDGTVKIWDLKTGEFLRNLVSLDSGGSGGVVWRLRCSNTKLVCAVGSRNGTEETKLMVLDFDVEDKKVI